MKTKKNLLEQIKELEKRPTDNVTIKNCHVETKVVFDSHVLRTIHEIAKGLNSNATALGYLSQTLSNDRIEVAAISIGAKYKLGTDELILKNDL